MIKNRKVRVGLSVCAIEFRFYLSTKILIKICALSFDSAILTRILIAKDLYSLD